MAQHRTSEGPRVEWGSIVKGSDGYRLATMVTVGGAKTEQSLSDPMSRPEAEERFRIWAAEHLFGWEEE